MEYIFTEEFPNDLSFNSILISGNNSVELNGIEYLIIKKEDNKNIEKIFEIRYEYSCSPFKEAIITDNILAVGHQDNFYIFDLTRQENILTLDLNGYFGHLYIHEDNFYVAHAYGIYCMDKNGNIKWNNNNLGIDGVLIFDFYSDIITGTGEWDPPGGWIDFILDKETGILKE